MDYRGVMRRHSSPASGIGESLLRDAPSAAIATVKINARFARCRSTSFPPVGLLIAQAAAIQIRQIEKLSSLADVELRVLSQNGEDGIIEWLIHRLRIEPLSFVEIGAEINEANTRFLLDNRGWKGLYIDGNPSINELRDSFLWRQDISAVHSFVNAENVNSLIGSAGFKGQIGLLSLDIDGNDYWVWRAIEVVNPAIVICEYNAVLGDLLPLVIPYDPLFRRTRAHPSNIYWGASIAALVQLASEKGYRLAGTNSHGLNAFFVRNDYAPRLDGRIADTSPRMSRYRTAASGFRSGLNRFEMIADQVVIDLRDGAQRRLRDLQPVYSEAWIREQT